MLDMRQAESLIAQLRSGEVRATQPIDPALPLEMARARRDVERASRRWQTMKRGGGRRRGRVSSPPA